MIPGVGCGKSLPEQEVTHCGEAGLVPGLVKTPSTGRKAVHNKDLTLVIQAWPRLPSVVREAVLSLLGTAGPTSDGPDQS